MNKILAIVLVLSCSLAADNSDKNYRLHNQQEWSGEYYQKNSSGQYAMAMEFLSELRMDDFSNVLDIGCGTGEIAAAIAINNRHSNVVGLDASLDMIKTARKTHASVSNVKFIVPGCSKT